MLYCVYVSSQGEDKTVRFTMDPIGSVEDAFMAHVQPWALPHGSTHRKQCKVTGVRISGT